MRKKALILDLDNTLYSVHSIGGELFASLFVLIEQDANHREQMERIKDDIMRRPFQFVARDYGFSEGLTEQGVAFLKNLIYQGKIEPFGDYSFVRGLPLDKFLVTTGFLKLQQSKVEGMKLENDFKEIHIVDPAASERGKKDVFADILRRHGYANEEVLVIGDDLHSEIKAAQELGIDAILYDKFNIHGAATSVVKISDFSELADLLRY